MRRVNGPGAALLVLMLLGGCGGPTDRSESEKRKADSTPHVMPTATPIQAGPGSFDPDEAFPDYVYTHADRFWVQLDHREVADSTIVIGIEPSIDATDLSAELANVRGEFEGSPTARNLDSGTIDSALLGGLVWSWARMGEDDIAMEQIVVLANHPRDGSLVIARAEYPEGTAEMQEKLDELVAAAEIVAPSL